jgi:hypothetical protein
MTFNDQLKTAYRTLHAKVVETVDADSAVDHLAAAGILSPADTLELTGINERMEKTRQLLAILHSVGRSESFIQLHEAIKKVEAYSHLIEEIEKLCGAQTSAAPFSVSAIRTGKNGRLYNGLVRMVIKTGDYKLHGLTIQYRYSRLH